MSAARFSCLLLFLFVFAFTTAAAADPFEVWEQDGTIWARELATGDEWPISRGANAHSPYADGRWAIWIADWSYAADVMGARLTQDHDPNNTFIDAAIAVQPEIAWDPRISDIGNVEGDRLYATWKMNGGIWAVRIGDFAPPPVEVVPDYTGPYSLDGHTLTWDDGTMELWFPTPEIPEPSTVVMLLVGLVCVLLKRTL
jgi:hypothetical protein